MTLLITGGTGFLGAYLARHAVEQGAEVVLFDRYPSLARLGGLEDRLTLVQGDVLEPQELLAAMQRHRVDRVAHLAFLPGPSSPEHSVPYLRVQCMGTANVFEACRIHGVQRVAFASSVAVFGHAAAAAGEADEDAPAHPDDLYGTCKLWGEHVAAHYNASYGLEILSLRVCSSMGVGRLDRASLASGLMTARDNVMAAPELLALGRPVTMPPDDQRSDFLYAADTALAFWLALERPRPPHSVFNLRGEQRPVGDLTRHLRQLLPEAAIDVSTAPAMQLQLMDGTRLAEELGFAPRYTLERAADEYVARVREREARR